MAPGGAAAGPTSEKLADGVFRINGAYNALAIEFADHVLIFEPGPQNEARSQAIIAEAKKLIPNKPIRYGVISHHHFDHTGGHGRTVVAEGITIVTPEVNKAFLERAFTAPRTLAGDALAKNPARSRSVEGFTGDKRVFTDATRTLRRSTLSRACRTPTALVVGYLPKEKILVYADMFNLPPANRPQVPNPPVVGTHGLCRQHRAAGPDAGARHVGAQLNPDRLTTVAEINATLGAEVKTQRRALGPACSRDSAAHRRRDDLRPRQSCVGRGAGHLHR